MAKNKIYWMRGASEGTGEERRAVKAHKKGITEEGLFRFDITGPGKLVFVEIERMEEESFLDVLVRNCVKSVIDIRVNTVFFRPKFRHKRIVDYLYQRGIKYVEYNVAIHEYDCVGGKTKFEKMSAEALDRGMTLCLIDANARERGRDMEVRRMVGKLPNFVAEVNVRSLLGLSRN